MDKTKQAVAIFDRLADLYQEKFMDVSLYQEALNVFRENLPVAAQVLDTACGPGNVAKYLLTIDPGLQILGTDLSPSMLALARSNNPTARFQILDSRNLKDLQKTFDGVICSFCLPYFSKNEAIRFISDSAEVLNANGVLYISTMEDDNRKSGIERSGSGDEMFMNYHEAEYLVKALSEEGFKILHQQRKSYIYHQKEVTDLLLVAQKSA